MVTKQFHFHMLYNLCLILAKNHMVTKLSILLVNIQQSLILAKNHMVTKPLGGVIIKPYSLILAKNHMVTKHILVVDMN